MEQAFSNDCELIDKRSDNNKTKLHVTVRYTTRITFKIDCDLSQVEEWFSDGENLVVVLKNGDVEEVEGIVWECDYTSPDAVVVRNGDDNDEYETITV